MVGTGVRLGMKSVLRSWFVKRMWLSRDGVSSATALARTMSSSGKSVCIRGVCNAHWLKDGVSSTAALWLTMSSSGKSVCTRGVCNAHWLKDGVSSTAALWFSKRSSGKSGFTRGVRKAYWLADPLVPVQGRCVPSSGEECVQGRLFNCWCFLVIKQRLCANVHAQPVPCKLLVN